MRSAAVILQSGGIPNSTYVRFSNYCDPPFTAYMTAFSTARVASMISSFGLYRAILIDHLLQLTSESSGCGTCRFASIDLLEPESALYVDGLDIAEVHGGWLSSVRQLNPCCHTSFSLSLTLVTYWLSFVKYERRAAPSRY
jgi:hypothetical protein